MEQEKNVNFEFHIKNLLPFLLTPCNPLHLCKLALSPAINALFSEWISPFAQVVVLQGSPLNPAGTLAN